MYNRPLDDMAKVDACYEDIDDLVCETLRNGNRIPKLGFWNALSKSTGVDLEQALSSGYRHIILDPRTDSEDVNIGKTLETWIRKQKSQRDELFISVMFDLSQQRPVSNGYNYINQRLQSLGCTYLDMVILHKSDPNPIGDNLRQRNSLIAAWKGIERLVSENHTRGLSLSNFRQEEVELILTSSRTMPDVLWFLDPPGKLGWKDLKQARGYCQYNELKIGVLPRLDRPESEWVRSTCPKLVSVSKRHGRTPVQVFQRFHLQKNILVSIAANDKMIDSTFKVFDFFLPKEDIEELEVLPI